MMKKIEDYKKILEEHKSELEKEYGVKEIGIFGSFIKGIEQNESDLDVLVDFHETIDLLRFVHLKNDLSELLDVNVDLVMKSSLKPNIGKRILSEVIYL